MKRKEAFKDFFVSRFILILVCVVIAEYAVKFLLDYSMLPVLKNWFFQEMQVQGALSIVEILLFAVFLLIDLFLGSLKLLVPEREGGLIDHAMDAVEGFAVRVVPDIAGDFSVDQLSVSKAWLLVVLIFMAIVIFLLPIGIAIRTFATMVNEEVQYIQMETEEFYKEYERKRNLLLSDIAHDLKTPITTIAGYATALNDGMVTEEDKKKEYLQAIAAKSERMSELITLLFEYVRLGTEGFHLKKESVDLPELLRKNAALVYSDMEEKGMEFYVNIPETVCKVMADEVQLSRVITNLLANSMKHNPPGTEVTLEFRYEYGEAEIIIADNGNEIPQEIATHIFEPFVVGEKSRRTKNGSGLGLSIAKKIIEMHGWSLTLLQGRKGYKKAFIIKTKIKEERGR